MIPLLLKMPFQLLAMYVVNRLTSEKAWVMNEVSSRRESRKSWAVPGDASWCNSDQDESEWDGRIKHKSRTCYRVDGH